jgi:hypothetical protein
MEDLTVTELLRRAVALLLDKLNEHNPEAGFLPLGPSTTGWPNT